MPPCSSARLRHSARESRSDLRIVDPPVGDLGAERQQPGPERLDIALAGHADAERHPARPRILGGCNHQGWTLVGGDPPEEQEAERARRARSLACRWVVAKRRQRDDADRGGRRNLARRQAIRDMPAQGHDTVRPPRIPQQPIGQARGRVAGMRLGIVRHHDVAGAGALQRAADQGRPNMRHQDDDRIDAVTGDKSAEATAKRPQAVEPNCADAAVEGGDHVDMGAGRPALFDQLVAGGHDHAAVDLGHVRQRSGDVERKPRQRALAAEIQEQEPLRRSGHAHCSASGRNLVFIVFYLTITFYKPNMFGHPDNYIKANPMVTPTHIVPEWYFLPYYAILKSIPDKLGGAIAMGASMAVLFLLPIIDISQYSIP